MALWGTGSASSIAAIDQKLCDACRNGRMEKAKEALEAGANPSVQFRLALGEITPIFLCASKGYINIAQLLIDYNANLNKRMDFDGTTILHHAASNDQSAMCEFLIKQGCNVNVQDKLGRTPLMDAAEIGSIEVITVLCNNGANVNIEDKEHYSALSYCLDFVNNREQRFLNAAWKLIENNANPNFAGKYGNRTLLHCIVAQGNFERVKLLIETYHAAINVYDAQSKTPIDIAKDGDLKEMHAYLVEMQRQNESRCVLL